MRGRLRKPKGSHGGESWVRKMVLSVRPRLQKLATFYFRDSNLFRRVSSSCGQKGREIFLCFENSAKGPHWRGESSLSVLSVLIWLLHLGLAKWWVILPSRMAAILMFKPLSRKTFALPKFFLNSLIDKKTKKNHISTKHFLYSHWEAGQFGNKV